MSKNICPCCKEKDFEKLEKNALLKWATGLSDEELEGKVENMGILTEKRLQLHIDECNHRIKKINDFTKNNVDANQEECAKNIAVLVNAVNAIEEYKKYKTLEEQGKLPKLPCAVGDMVYIVSRGKVLPLKVLEIQIFLLEGELVTQIKCTDAISYGYMHFLTKEIGETIFLTHEEAEAALKELTN